MTSQQIQMRSNDREFRIVSAGLRIERRSEGDKQSIVGHAAVFDKQTTLYRGKYWTWREVVRRGAFTNAIAEAQDVRALINHDKNLVLGRSSAGTLKLSQDEVGLLVSIDPPDTQAARDLAVSIARGDVSGMSFGFRVRPNGDKTTITVQGEMETDDRELIDLDLLDVSVVTYPAYPETDVSLRSIAEVRDVPRRVPPLRLRIAERRLRLAEAGF